MKKIFLIAALSIILMNCNSDDNTTQDDFEPINIEFTLIGKGGYYNMPLTGEEGISQQNIVISDELVWEELIEQMNSVNNISNHFSTTDIDFENYQLIVVIDEVKLTVSEVTITSVVENRDNIVVTTDSFSTVSQAQSQPFHIVQIPKSDKPVVFEVE